MTNATSHHVEVSSTLLYSGGEICFRGSGRVEIYRDLSGFGGLRARECLSPLAQIASNAYQGERNSKQYARLIPKI